MEKKTEVILRQIIDFITSVNSYKEGKTFANFQNNEMMQDAVLRKLELIGEAIKRLPDNFIQEHSSLPLKEAIAVRNRLIHEYDDIDFKIIWDTINVDLPMLLTDLKEIL